MSNYQEIENAKPEKDPPLMVQALESKKLCYDLSSVKWSYLGQVAWQNLKIFAISTFYTKVISFKKHL